jgi:hypothetical protein
MSAAAYKQALHRVAVEESRAQQRVKRAFHAHLVVAVRAGLAHFASDQAHVALRLLKLHPPADADSANELLAKAFADNARATRSLVARLAHAKSVKQARRIVSHDAVARRVGNEIDAALKTLRNLGYATGH